MSMTRRTFTQFLGASMVGVSLAVFGSGVVSSPVTAFIPGLDPDGDKVRKYVAPDFVEAKWIGGESDTLDTWGPVWAKMAAKIHPQMVENVFKQSPLLAYLQAKS